MNPFCMALSGTFLVYVVVRLALGPLALLLPAALLARFTCAFDWSLALIHRFSLGLP